MRIQLCLPSNSDLADDVTADADDSPVGATKGVHSIEQLSAMEATQPMPTGIRGNEITNKQINIGQLCKWKIVVRCAVVGVCVCAEVCVGTVGRSVPSRL